MPTSMHCSPEDDGEAGTDRGRAGAASDEVWSAGEGPRIVGEEFSSLNVQVVLDQLRRAGGAGLVETVLRRAGETRTVDELTVDGSFSSYGQFRSLLRATASVLGGVEAIARMGVPASSRSTGRPHHVAAMHALGSPSAVYLATSKTDLMLGTATITRAEEVGPTEVLIHQRLVPGYEPFPERCAFMRGSMLPAVTALFGLAPARVTEERCQCDGHPSCRFRIRWETTPTDRGTDYFRVRTNLLEDQLDALQRTVSELVSAASFEEAVAHILEEAAATVLATSFVLVVEPTPWTPRRVYGRGLSQTMADAIGRRLETERAEQRAGLSVAEIRSSRRSYGWLAGINVGSRPFGAAELEMLRSFARLAAAALDSATALEEARRAGRTAQALLDLANSLSEVTSLRAVASKLAAAVPAVVGLDRAAVVIDDPHDATGYSVGLFGYPDASAPFVLEYFATHPRVVRRTKVGHARIEQVGAEEQIAMKAMGVGTITSIPITWEGRSFGAIFAASTSEDEDLRPADPEVQNRLRGMAAQAVTAVRNAQLHDEIQHQAMHDSLTGLPNRAFLHQQLQQLSAAARSDESVAILYLDLDHFKEVNDRLGHSGGDCLLQQVARRFPEVLRPADSVGRLGGDEFVVVAAAPSDDLVAQAIADRILSIVREPFRIGEEEIAVTASIGIAIGAGVDASELLREADAALYEAKSAGRDRFVLHHPPVDHVAASASGVPRTA